MRSLSDILKDHQEEIIRAWARSLKGMTGSTYEAMSLEELVQLCSDLFPGYLDALEKGSYEAVRRSMESLIALKSPLDLKLYQVLLETRASPLASTVSELIRGFRLSEVLRTFYVFRPVILPFLKEEYRGDPVQLTEAWGKIDDCLAMIAFQFSDIYQGEVNQLVQTHLKEVENLNLKLARLSFTNGLTGLYNHKYFHYMLDKEIMRVRRYGGPLSVMLIDIDHLKRINELHGYESGDVVIQKVGQILTRSFRQVDTVARYGSEEFGVIMPETAAEKAVAKGEALRGEIETNPFTDVVGRPVGVTVSIGVSGGQGVELQKERVIAEVEGALVRAKGEGRNRVCRA